MDFSLQIHTFTDNNVSHNASFPRACCHFLPVQVEVMGNSGSNKETGAAPGCQWEESILSLYLTPTTPPIGGQSEGRTRPFSDLSGGLQRGIVSTLRLVVLDTHSEY